MDPKIGDKPKVRILDLGCGPGVWAEFLYPRIKNAIDDGGHVQSLDEMNLMLKLVLRNLILSSSR